MSFGSQLVALREARGWSRNRLQQKTGIAYSYLRAIENDEWLPGREHVEKLVKALGPEAGHLMAERDRVEYGRIGLDPDSTVLLKEISDDLTDADRRELASLQRKIKERQERRSKRTGR